MTGDDMFKMKWKNKMEKNSRNGDRRSGHDRRKFPRSKSIYKFNFDRYGNWWEEKRSGNDRRNFDH